MSWLQRCPLAIRFASSVFRSRLPDAVQNVINQWTRQRYLNTFDGDYRSLRSSQQSATIERLQIAEMDIFLVAQLIDPVWYEHYEIDGNALTRAQYTEIYGEENIPDGSQPVSETMSLKPAYWLFPNLPVLEQLPAEQHEYTQMGIFDVENNNLAVTSRDGSYGLLGDLIRVPVNILRTFEVHLHDGRISPNAGHIRIPIEQSNQSFWSVVVHPRTGRVAATLHWLLDRAAKAQLLNILGNSGNGENNQNSTLQGLINAMSNDTVFRNSSVLTKLRQLTGVRAAE